MKKGLYELSIEELQELYLTGNLYEGRMIVGSAISSGKLGELTIDFDLDNGNVISKNFKKRR